MELLISIKVSAALTRGAVRVSRKKMDEADVRLDEIKAEIRESIDRAKALVHDTELFVRDHVNQPHLPEGK